MDKIIDILADTKQLNKDRLKVDSREVNPGDIFFAVKGVSHDGHDHIREVLGKGVSCVICERIPRCLSLPRDDLKKVLVVNNTREVLGEMARHFFRDPSDSLEVYGVTGTNGKTTTVFLIDSVLKAAGIDSGFISTVFTKASGDAFSRSSMTTPDLISLNRLLSEMVTNGKHAAVVEISSHALDQQRTCGIKLDSAVFTNITPEHLDYHKNMEEYLGAKSRIFLNIKPEGTAVLNADDAMVIGLRDTVISSRVVTFGMEKKADVRAENLRMSSEAMEFDLIAAHLGTARIRTPLIGRHNVYNMLGAVASLINKGLDIDQIKEGLEKVSRVPGRLETVHGNAPFSVFVDYAHTPNALENVLKCARTLTSGRLICVFGCGGDRDRAKRPVMGRIAAGICDCVILTSDNPRSEKPDEILRQIEKGIPGRRNYSIMTDRRQAIRKALETASEGDVVIIAGKGHEDCQIIGDRVMHFDDKEVAGEVLREMGYQGTDQRPKTKDQRP